MRRADLLLILINKQTVKYKKDPIYFDYITNLSIAHTVT